MCFAAAGTVIGGVVGGPPGALVGGVVGTEIHQFLDFLIGLHYRCIHDIIVCSLAKCLLTVHMLKGF